MRKINYRNIEASQVAFDVIKYVLIIFMSIVCLLPFVIIISGSFSDNAIVMSEGYGILPKGITLAAYQSIFENPGKMFQAYKMTIYYTIMGTTLGLFVIVLTAYTISRPSFKYRNIISFMIYFTSIFGGGMVPWYLMYTTVLGLKGTTFIIWFPGIITPFLIILMRTFIKSSVPESIIESAKLDGANEVTLLAKIVAPILKPGLATVGLFLALGYWNDWYRSSMFSIEQSTYELQFYLYNLINQANAMNMLSDASVVISETMPSQTVKMAMAVVVTGPIFLVYPFVQRYFISGITVGAVKG